MEKLKEWIPFKWLKLLYRGSRDGNTAESFHNKCNNLGATICLYKNEKDVYLEDIILFLGRMKEDG